MIIASDNIIQGVRAVAWCSEQCACCSVSRCGNTQFSMGRLTGCSSSQAMQQMSMKIQHQTKTTRKHTHPCQCVQHVTKNICRALCNSVEQTKRTIADITNSQCFKPLTQTSELSFLLKCGAPLHDAFMPIGIRTTCIFLE